ncbi:non-specific lipid-transfer protein 4-like [Phragmites australis]|uniref:non-specific lipid-transfer protein 4-like n=1 Tax=Phragmites australis TaxID=29695 RepID=UPI002D78DB8B|nr:non-specific lipid-transfer protein 4-like [Phragmites australis]
MARSAQLAVLVALLVATAPAVSAVTCGQVVSMLSPCLNYAMGRSPTTTPACCAGVRGLNNAARTTADRQTTCNCLKQQTSGMGGLKPNIVAGIPSKCGVSVPYAISPSTDCSKVH